MKKFIFAIMVMIPTTILADEVSDLITKTLKTRAYNPDALVVKCEPGVSTEFSIVKCDVTGTNAYGGAIHTRYTIMVSKGKVTILDKLYDE